MPPNAECSELGRTLGGQWPFQIPTQGRQKRTDTLGVYVLVQKLVLTLYL